MELGKRFLEINTAAMAPLAEAVAAQTRQVFDRYDVPSSEHMAALYEGLVKPEPILLEPEPSPPIEVPELDIDEIPSNALGRNWAKIGAIATIAVGVPGVVVGALSLLSG